MWNTAVRRRAVHLSGGGGCSDTRRPQTEEKGTFALTEGAGLSSFEEFVSQLNSKSTQTSRNLAFFCTLHRSREPSGGAAAPAGGGRGAL